MLLACVVLGTVAMYQGMDYQYQILYGGTFTEKKFSEVSLNSADVVTGEYLYQGTDVSRTKTEQSVTGENVEMEDVQHHGLRFQILGKATGEGAYLEVPAFYYPGYVAKDLQGKQYQVTRSEDNNRIHVELPADFDGVLEVFYKEPTLFLLGDVISVLAVIGLIGFHKIEKFGEKNGACITKNDSDYVDSDIFISGSSILLSAPDTDESITPEGMGDLLFYRGSNLSGGFLWMRSE